MKYTEENRGWWVEIEGAADLSMMEMNKFLSSLIDGWPILMSVLKANAFTNRQGEDFELTDGENDWMKLSSRQRKWLTDQVIAASLDEVVSEKA